MGDQSDKNDVKPADISELEAKALELEKVALAHERHARELREFMKRRKLGEVIK